MSRQRIVVLDRMHRLASLAEREVERVLLLCRGEVQRLEAQRRDLDAEEDHHRRRREDVLQDSDHLECGRALEVVALRRSAVNRQMAEARQRRTEAEQIFAQRRRSTEQIGSLRSRVVAAEHCVEDRREQQQSDDLFERRRQTRYGGGIKNL